MPPLPDGSATVQVRVVSAHIRISPPLFATGSLRARRRPKQFSDRARSQAFRCQKAYIHLLPFSARAQTTCMICERLKLEGFARLMQHEAPPVFLSVTTSERDHSSNQTNQSCSQARVKHECFHVFGAAKNFSLLEIGRASCRERV